MNRLFLSICLAILVSMGVPCTSQASLISLSSLYVFGDSLSDGGNFPLGPLFPPPPYAGARYSNGPVAVEYLWSHYNPGDPGGFTPSNFGGTNYAFGGATTGTDNYNSINPVVPPALQPVFATAGGMQNQIAQFSASCAGCFDPATSLFVLWGFPNDVFMNPGTDPVVLVNAGVSNITNGILALAAEGAQHFLVPNMGDLGSTPAFLGTPQAGGVTALTQGFNAVLAGALTALDATLPGEIVQFDTYGLLQSVIANPGSYGFTDVTDQCVLSPGCDPDTWLFWDSVHPTTKGHSLIGAGFASAVPAPGTIALLIAGLGAFVVRRQIRAG